MHYPLILLQTPFGTPIEAVVRVLEKLGTLPGNTPMVGDSDVDMNTALNEKLYLCWNPISERVPADRLTAHANDPSGDTETSQQPSSVEVVARIRSLDGQITHILSAYSQAV